MSWTIPELWPESVVFIVGGGPSILQQDLSLIHKERVIGVNQAYKLGPWVDICWSGDKGFFTFNIDKKPSILEYGGLIACCAAHREDRQRGRVKYVKRSKMHGLETKKRTHIAWNYNSGASAINLAYWLGAKTVVLLGFDMSLPEDPHEKCNHWHQDYGPIRKRNGQRHNPYKRFMNQWPKVHKDADTVGLRIINATQGGVLEEFERMDYEEICRRLSSGESI